MAEDGLTVGVEEEFLLVGPDGRLARSGPEVVHAADNSDDDLQEELARCQVESATSVCTTAASTCGCHVHVGVGDRATGIEVSNHVRAWLPVLLALTANSPFSHGGDTRYSSWRYVRWTLWPSAGPPPLFESVDHYDDSVDAMLRAGAILDRGMVYWDGVDRAAPLGQRSSAAADCLCPAPPARRRRRRTGWARSWGVSCHDRA